MLAPITWDPGVISGSHRMHWRAQTVSSLQGELAESVFLAATIDPREYLIRNIKRNRKCEICDMK